MTDEGFSDEWPQFRRIGETKGRLAALEDIRLRLIEMSDIAGAEALAMQIDALRRCLDYQQHVMVAMRARLAVRGMQSLPAIRLGVLKGGADRAARGGRLWHLRLRRGVGRDESLLGQFSGAGHKS